MPVDRHVDNFGRNISTLSVFLKFFRCLIFVQIVSYSQFLWMDLSPSDAEALIRKVPDV